MISVKGYAAASATSAIEPFGFERRELRPNDVLIDIRFCGICHSDIHQARNKWGGSIFPMVPGHEIVGIVAKTGEAVTKFRIGSMVVVGAPEHPVPVHAFSLIPKRRTLAGSMIGGVAETQEMLDFCAQHQIVSDIEVIPVQQINEAYARVLRSDVRYRFVIDMSTLAAE